MDILHLEFMRNATMAALLASVACGIIGTLVVVNRQVFMAGGVAHTAYGGVGLAFYLGLPVLPCAVGFTVFAALLMAHASFGHQERSDALIGVMWAGGMALGILLVDITPGYNVDLMSYLFGSILAVPHVDIWIMFGLDALIVGTVLFWYKDFLAFSFDPEFARSTGVPVRALHYLLQALTAVTVVMTIQVAGLILVIALLTIPPMLAELWTTSLLRMMLLAMAAGMLFCLTGLLLSYHLDLTSGASIIAVATIGYLLARGARHFVSTS